VQQAPQTPMPPAIHNDDNTLGVEQRLTNLLSQDNPYMRQAETTGLKQANRRGLLNSTMAVSAVEDSRIRSALPIASQDSSQANSRYMQGRDIDSSERMQGRQIASTEGISSADRGSRENLTREGYQLDRDTQAADIDSRHTMQTRDLDASRDAQGRDIASRQDMQRADIEANRNTQAADIASRQWLAQFDADTQTRLQTLDNETRTLMQGLDLDAQQRIAGLNVSADNRNNASRMLAGFEETYSRTINEIMNNPDIPAEARQAHMDHANRVRASNLAAVEQLYGVDLVWEE
jgi:hypothetical protein